MRLKIAGGVGEHGRNSFLIETGKLNILVDCGLMPCGDKPYPELKREEIEKIKYLFLTHSHADHTGAIDWLKQNGFQGKVIASRETLGQIGEDNGWAVPVESFRCPDFLSLKWGRTGHCVGSLWYLIEIDGRKILFSGDYIESSTVYETDPIRKVYADIAVLDSAYGAEKRTAEEMKADFMAAAEKMLAESRNLLLPVPKYGRGMEMLCMLSERYPKAVFYADKILLKQIENAERDRIWIRNGVSEKLSGIRNIERFDAQREAEKYQSLGPVQGKDEQNSADALNVTKIYFISDPQLKANTDMTFAECLAGSGGRIILTGTVDEGSGSSRLLKDGKAVFERFPVHCTNNDRIKLENRNYFRRVIPFHCAETQVKSREIEF